MNTVALAQTEGEIVENLAYVWNYDNKKSLDSVAEGYNTLHQYNLKIGERK